MRELEDGINRLKKMGIEAIPSRGQIRRMLR